MTEEVKRTRANENIIVTGPYNLDCVAVYHTLWTNRSTEKAYEVGCGFMSKLDLNLFSLKTTDPLSCFSFTFPSMCFLQLMIVFCHLFLFSRCRSFQVSCQNACGWQPDSHTSQSHFPPSALEAWAWRGKKLPISCQRLCSSLQNTIQCRWRFILWYPPVIRIHFRFDDRDPLF